MAPKKSPEQIRISNLEAEISGFTSRIRSLEFDLLRANGRERDLQEKLDAAELALWDYQNIEENVCPGKTIQEYIGDIERYLKGSYLQALDDAETEIGWGMYTVPHRIELDWLVKDAFKKLRNKK